MQKSYALNNTVTDRAKQGVLDALDSSQIEFKLCPNAKLKDTQKFERQNSQVISMFER